MYDFDVAAVALTSPPSEAPLQAYRPAVMVLNNGVHDAIATGYLNIYSAGLLIFTTTVLSPTITPGATGIAIGADTWTPPAQGPYVIFGVVSCDKDQYEPDNHLAPTTITVTPPPSPPPPKTLDDIYDKLGTVSSEATLLAVAAKVTPDPSTDATQKQVRDTVATEATLAALKLKTDNLALESTLAEIKADTDGLSTESTLTAVDDKIGTRLPAALGTHGGVKVDPTSAIEALTTIPSLLECLGIIPITNSATPLGFASKTRTIVVTSHPANTDLVFVGQEFLTAAGDHALTVLSPGDSVALDYDDSTDAIYVCAASGSQNIIAACTVIPGA